MDNKFTSVLSLVALVLSAGSLGMSISNASALQTSVVGGGQSHAFVEICHLAPPVKGRAGQRITLRVSEEAAAAHLRLHAGDQHGACEDIYDTYDDVNNGGSGHGNPKNPGQN